MRITIKYSFFASVSILVNLLFQYLSSSFYDGKGKIYFTLSIGTFFGLLAKYILDKKFIFYYKTINRSTDIKKFMLYSSLSVITTIIFWSFELGFYYVGGNETSKYIGAIAGLTIGYSLKYFLDKKFVFRNN